MLWIGICEAVSVAIVGGVVGGCLMAYSQKGVNKFNMKLLEDYWNSDIKALRSGMAMLDNKISTISVSKPVWNGEKSQHNKGDRSSRHNNKRG